MPEINHDRNRKLVDDVLASLREVLYAFVKDIMQENYGESWEQKAREVLRGNLEGHDNLDLQALLVIIKVKLFWDRHFQRKLRHEGRNLLHEVQSIRNKWAHQRLFNDEDTDRALDTSVRLLQRIVTVSTEEQTREIASAYAARHKQSRLELLARLLQQADPTSEADGAGESQGAGEHQAKSSSEAEAASSSSAESEPVQTGDAGKEAESKNPLDAAIERETAAAGATEDATATAAMPQKASAGGRRWGLKHLFNKLGPPPIAQQTASERHQTMLDIVEEDLRPFQGPHPLPFLGITMHVLAQDQKDADVYIMALDRVATPFPLAVQTRLLKADIKTPPGFAIRYEIHTDMPVEKTLQEAFKHGPIYVDRQRMPEGVEIHLSVLAGKTDQKQYTLTSREAPYNVGRLKFVDGAHTNHVAFLDPDDHPMSAQEKVCNGGVSRVHAQIIFDAERWCFCWKNEKGSFTLLDRDEYPRPLPVTHHEEVLLRDQDVFHLGEYTAVVRFDFRRA